MSINRTYKDGALVGYAKKEMKDRGKRMYYREQIKDLSIRVAIMSVFIMVMTTAFLIGTN